VRANRRDALNLAQAAQGWTTDRHVRSGRKARSHERPRARSRGRAHLDYKHNSQQVASFLLRLGRYNPGKKTWGKVFHFRNEFDLALLDLEVFDRQYANMSNPREWNISPFAENADIDCDVTRFLPLSAQWVLSQ
jgi:hypothetical protein